MVIASVHTLTSEVIRMWVKKQMETGRDCGSRRMFLATPNASWCDRLELRSFAVSPLMQVVVEFRNRLTGLWQTIIDT